MASLGNLRPRIRAPQPGPVGRAYVDRLAETECPAFTARRKRREEATGAPHDPIVWAEASGSNVVDVDGNVYVDLTSGFGVASVGHGHPRVLDAVRMQSERLMHALGDVHPSDVKIRLLEALAARMPFAGARTLLSQSGSDAVETALKTAMLASRKPGVLAFEGGYHGLSHGPLAVCGYSEGMRAPFAAQLNPHVRFAPFPRADAPVEAAIAAVEACIDAQTGAILVEPALGRGGVHFAPPGFLAALSAMARRRGLVVIADEIFCGLHRTGPALVSVAEGLVPDLICLGKALGGGMPISACVGRPEVMAAWGEPGGEALHTGTFFGHPVACAAALAALDVLETERLGERAERLGAQLMQHLAERAPSCVVGIRGRGLMIGVQLDAPGKALTAVRGLLEQGYLALPAGADASVVQLVPPLCIDEALLLGAADALLRVLEALSPAVVPDTREPLRTEILALMDALADGHRDEAMRAPLLRRVAAYQEAHLPVYARLCAARRRARDEAVAALPTDVFRHARVALHPPEADVRVFRTSGTTSGARGEHAMRELGLYDRAARLEAARMLFPDVSRMRLLIVAPSEAEAPDSSLSYMLARFGEWFGSELHYGWRDGQLDLATITSALAEAEARGEPVAILGTSFAFVHLDDALGERRFALPSGSRVMQTGGFKGRSRSVEPDAMRTMLAERFGVPQTHVVAEYGMTELGSQMYETSLRDALAGLPPSERRYAVPGWLAAIPVDPDTLLPVARGEAGLLRLEDLANLDSCAVLQTSDMAREVEGGFVLLGRAPGATPRGCSLAVDEALGGER